VRKTDILLYEGSFDSSRPNNETVITGEYLKAAVGCAGTEQPPPAVLPHSDEGLSGQN
jgi:hypothetical protein